MVDEMTQTDPLVAFIVDAVQELGLRARFPDITGDLEPVVLRRRSNAIIHLAPLPVVARVANWTGSVRDDPAANLRLEVQLSRWAASRNFALPVPLAAPISGPHDEDGVAFTLWPLLDEAPGLTDPALAGRSLAALHKALAGFPAPMPGPDPIAQDANVAMLLLGRMGYLDPEEALLVADECRDLLNDLKVLLAQLPPERLVPLHGDAHPGNAQVIDGHTVRWGDLEDAWRGPIEWDVACLELSSRWTSDRQREIAVRQYCAAADVTLSQDLMRACRRLRNAQLEAWTALASAVAS